jgi:hypothetical protein
MCGRFPGLQTGSLRSPNKNNELYLNVKTPDAQNPKKILNFNFTDLESHFIGAQKRGLGKHQACCGQSCIGTDLVDFSTT